MDDRFFNGMLGAEVVVCGQRLGNLTPWHVLILHAIGSPLVGDSKTVGPADIQLFLKTITSRYPDTPSYRPRLRDVRWRLKLGREKTFLREAATLKRWLEVQMSVPQLYEVTHSTSSVKRGLTSPSIFALVVAIASKLSEPLDKVWNMRLAEARWLDTTLAELNGAELTISYEGEQVPDILNEMTEKEIRAQAKLNLPVGIYRAWLKARESDRTTHSKI